jgi:hypothetical protein
VAFIDVHEDVLYWWRRGGDDFTGYVVDYGTFPEQKGRKYFARRRCADAGEGQGRQEPRGDLYAGLDALVGNLMAREWGGATARCSGARADQLIDANWGESPTWSTSSAGRARTRRC